MEESEYELNWRSVMAEALVERADARGERSAPRATASDLAEHFAGVAVAAPTSARLATFAAMAPARDPASRVYSKQTEAARTPDLSLWFGLMATACEEDAQMEVDEARSAVGTASVDAMRPFDDADGSRSLDSEASSDLSAAYTYSDPIGGVAAADFRKA